MACCIVSAAIIGFLIMLKNKVFNGKNHAALSWRLTRKNDDEKIADQ
jgi:hypothetical protein